MGCNCKQIKKVGDKFNLFQTPTYERKGWKKIFGWFKSGIINAFNAILVSLFMLLLMPFIILIIFFNLLFNGKNVINLPFGNFLKKNQEGQIDVK